jgi:hypothetical protein
LPLMGIIITLVTIIILTIRAGIVIMLTITAIGNNNIDMCTAALGSAKPMSRLYFVLSIYGMRAITLISKSKPASQFTPTAVQLG